MCIHNSVGTDLDSILIHVCQVCSCHYCEPGFTVVQCGTMWYCMHTSLLPYRYGIRSLVYLRDKNGLVLQPASAEDNEDLIFYTGIVCTVFLVKSVINQS